MDTGMMSLLVKNQFGVLTRITGLFGRRGYNIKALSVGETEDPALSRITIVTQGDEQKLNQIYCQVSKLEEVMAAVLLPPDQTIVSELAFIKLKRSPPEAPGEITELSDGGCVVRVMGTPQDIDRAVHSLKGYGIIEMSRTGPTALENTSNALNKNMKEEAF